MPEKFAIVGESEPYPGAKKRTYVLGKKQPKYGSSNGEIDLYPAGRVKSGVARALTDDKEEQEGTLRDLKKPSSPLGYLTTEHSLKKGTLRIITQKELDTLLASHEAEEVHQDIGRDYPTRSDWRGEY